MELTVAEKAHKLDFPPWDQAGPHHRNPFLLRIFLSTDQTPRYSEFAVDFPKKRKDHRALSTTANNFSPVIPVF